MLVALEKLRELEVEEASLLVVLGEVKEVHFLVVLVETPVVVAVGEVGEAPLLVVLVEVEERLLAEFLLVFLLVQK